MAAKDRSWKKKSANRYALNVSFTVPAGVFPMSYDPCFHTAVGRWSDGAGTALGGKRRPVRDMDFYFAKPADAKRTAEVLKHVLETHRLKGNIEISDLTSDPPKKIYSEKVSASALRTRSTRRAGSARGAHR